MLHGTNDQEGIQGVLKNLLPDVKFDVLVKCGSFTHGQKKFRSCVGEHTALIKSAIYEVFRVEESHGRFPQPARTIMEAQRQCLGLVRRLPWCAPVSCRGAHIEAFVNGRKGYQSKGPHHLSSDSWQNRKLCHTCKQCMPNEEKEKMYDALAAAYQC